MIRIVFVIISLMIWFAKGVGVIAILAIDASLVVDQITQGTAQLMLIIASHCDVQPDAYPTTHFPLSMSAHASSHHE